MAEYLIVIFLFILGTVIGSFLNVCIHRMPKGDTVLYNPSSCPSCKNKLKLYDLVPVLSYVILKGRCRYCESKINPRYPFVELMTGLIFIVTYYSIGWNLILIKYLFIFSMLVIISFIDIKHQIIPNKLVIILLIWAVGWQIFFPKISLYQAGLGALLGGGLFFLAALISGGGMGGGDIKFMFAAGFFLGLTSTLLTIFLASLVGGIIGASLMMLKLKDRKDPIPFGPFLSFAVFISSLWGEEIIELYLQAFL